MQSQTSPVLVRRLIALSTGLLLSGACATTSDLQESAGAPTPLPSTAPQEEGMEGGMDMDAMMAAMMKAGTPGEAHKSMASHVGKWKVDGKMYMGPGAGPSPMMATAETEAIMGGRYTIEHFHSDFMGMPFEGMLISGYDNLSERYWNLWMDNMSTRYTPAWGTMKDDGTLEFHGTNYDPMTPEGRPNRTEIKMESDDHVIMKMYDTLPDGTEWIVMEFDYTRAE